MFIKCLDVVFLPEFVINVLTAALDIYLLRYDISTRILKSIATAESSFIITTRFLLYLFPKSGGIIEAYLRR